jgi:hypothetical protein
LWLPAALWRIECSRGGVLPAQSRSEDNGRKTKKNAMNPTTSKLTGSRLRREKEKEERRAVERHPFSETAEVLDVAGGMRLMGRVADISTEGCYVDTLSPFPQETLVRVKICKNGAEFICAGAVRNSQTGMGMGITFAEVTGFNRALLDNWLGKAPGAPVSAAPVFSSFAPVSQNSDSLVTRSAASLSPSDSLQEGDSLARRLIEVLHKKGQLSDSEVAALLPDEPF